MKVTVNNAEEASKLLNVPIEWVKLCQSREDVPGCNANRTINTTKLKIYINEHIEDLKEESMDSLRYWKTINSKKDAELKDLKKKQFQKNLIEPKDVKQLLVSLGTTISGKLNSWTEELPPKLVGKPVDEIKIVLDQAIIDILKVLKNKETSYGQ
jgi:hypothetical protein